MSGGLAMPRYVALLRGVNVGKGKRVPMAEWRAAMLAAGHIEVATLLNSGNAVFGNASRSPQGLADGIAALVRETFGVETTVVVKSARELHTIVDTAPFVPNEAEHARCLVVFAMQAATMHTLQALQPLLQPGERLGITPHAAYLLCPQGLLESLAGEALLGKLGRGVTTRNWATVLKLRALLGKPG